MGVPKFYRWLSERYPKINQIISDLMLMPEFDNLYLDMNGIIHHCTHPNDDDLAAALSDKDVMLGMFNYIDRIVSQIAKPRKFLFMAIDGVAPRAKLNQQRSRRFASAKDREAARLAAEQKGEVVDASAVFDSNCITPGTEFMQRVSEHLQYFIRKKQSEDPVWRRLTVVFSGHEVPGEGEHKIMQAIREIREAEGYDPNTTHCMYGQDADLIMLGLVTHEPHFTLLREVINFNQNRRPARNEPKNAKTLVKQTSTAQFQLLHISVLREYLQMELCQGLYRQQIPVSIERVIDDFVFMTFLVGNDFLPHLPSLDISEGAFDKLFAVYTSQMEDAARATGSVEGGYLTKSGSVPSLGRLERFLEVIGSMEDDIFKERAANEAEFAARRRKWERRDGGVKSEELSPEEEAAVLADREATFTAALHRARLEEQVQAGAGKAGAGAEAGAGPHLAQGTAPAGFELTKALYYFEKLGITPLHARVHRAIRLRYLEGLLWCLAYYYRGCISWGWFYPFHYGPMMSDMVGLDGLSKELRFDKGAPFKPFEQLLGCLPAASSQFLPAPYRKLMTTSSSPIADFYPADFRVDMNGKRNPWEGVNLLPFIDAQRMRVTLAQLCPPDCLTPAETKRNSFGDPIEFVYDSSPAFEGALHKSCNPAMGLPDLAKCKVRARSRKDMPFDRTDIVFKPEVKVGCVMPWPGFPSLHALPIPAAEIRPLKVNCFGSDSRYSTLTLVLPPIDPGTLPPTAHLAASTIGRSVFVNWPMMHEARVVSVSDAKHEYVLAPQTGPSGDPSGPSGGGPTQASKSAASSGVARSGPLGKYLHGLSGGGGTRGKGTRGKSKSPVEVDGVRLEITALSEEEGKHWKFQASDLRDEYLKGRGVPGQGGVDIGPVFARFTVAPLQGMKRDPRTGARSKVFAAASGESLADLPLQLAIWTDPSPDPRFLECGALGPTELAPLGSSAVVVASELPKEKPGAANGDESGLWPLHGAMGTVVGHDGRTVSLRVLKLPREPPFGLGIAAKVADMYFPTGAVARTLGLRPDILGRLLGSLVVAVDRNESYDLGLRLRASEPPPTKGAPRGPTLRVLGYLRQGQSQAPGSTGKGGKGGKQGACSQAAQAVEAGEAWVSERDSVRVVGSAPKAAAEKADAAQDKGAGWELSVKAVQLVQAYMQTFPRLFALLNATGSSDRFFSMGALFPPSPGATPGEVKTSREQLAEVVGWLDELEVSRLPRAPLSTHALASDAVKAIQKAADARQAALGAKQGELRFEVLHGLPLECLALAPSPNGQRDVKANYNQAMDPPVLGDRCLNAHDSGVPFGLRGTVVAIHFHSSAVEVVFDEQFVGGSSLQGSCDKFRGRLVPWRHLLKLPPAVPSAQTKQAVPEGAAAAKAEGKAEPSKMTPSEYIAEQKKKKKDAKKNEMRKAGAAAAAAVAEEEEEEEEEVVMAPSPAAGRKGAAADLVPAAAALFAQAADPPPAASQASRSPRHDFHGGFSKGGTTKQAVFSLNTPANRKKPRCQECTRLLPQELADALRQLCASCDPSAAVLLRSAPAPAAAPPAATRIDVMSLFQPTASGATSGAASAPPPLAGLAPAAAALLASAPSFSVAGTKSPRPSEASDPGTFDPGIRPYGAPAGFDDGGGGGGEEVEEEKEDYEEWAEGEEDPAALLLAVLQSQGGGGGGGGEEEESMAALLDSLAAAAGQLDEDGDAFSFLDLGHTHSGGHLEDHALGPGEGQLGGGGGPGPDGGEDAAAAAAAAGFEADLLSQLLAMGDLDDQRSGYKDSAAPPPSSAPGGKGSGKGGRPAFKPVISPAYQRAAVKPAVKPAANPPAAASTAPQQPGAPKPAGDKPAKPGDKLGGGLLVPSRVLTKKP